MRLDIEKRLLTPEAEQCRFEEVRQRVKKAGLAPSRVAAKEMPEKNLHHPADFLANMSHELRSPLNSVIGFSELLLDQMYGSINSKQQEYLKHIHSSGLHLLSIINDILDLATAESGILALELSDFSLRELLNDALLMHRETALKKRVTIHSDFAAQADLRIVADQKKLKQILFTLLGNAVKFTPAGGTVNVSTLRDDDFIEMTVADTGLGIKVDDIPNLFRAPSQLKVNGDDESEEVGEGLVLTRQLVELHGGRIWVKSYFGMGSRFTFSLPLTRSLNGFAPAEETDPIDTEVKTILLIEDEMLTLVATEHALREKGYRVVRAKDGEEGLGIARHIRPDLILLDLILPGINGFDVVEQLRAEQIAVDVPILIMTSMKIQSADRKRLVEKVWRIVEKGSLSTHEFIALVETAVGKKKAVIPRR